MKHKRSLPVFAGMVAVLLLTAAVSVGSRQEAGVSAEEEPLYMFNVIGDMQMGDPAVIQKKIIGRHWKKSRAFPRKQGDSLCRGSHE